MGGDEEEEGDEGGEGGNVNGAKFLNSGCLLGRAGQMRELLQYLQRYALSIRDDQQLVVRFSLEKPHLVGLDAKNDLFVTMHKETNSAAAEATLDIDFTFWFRNKSVGLVHFNNKKSNGLYDYYVTQMRKFQWIYFGGATDGPLLLRCVRLMAEKNYYQALQILRTPEVLYNRKSQGGENLLGDYLREKLMRILH